MTNLPGPKKTHLFTPGPTPVPDAVLSVMAQPIIHHRTPEWQATFARVLELLPPVFGTEHDVAMFTASGSGAMESAVTNVVRPGDEVIVASHGRFGARWATIAERVGATVHHHQTERGQRPDPTAVAALVEQHPNAVALYVTHSETSTGATSDAEAIGRAVRAARGGNDLLLVLDAISSLGAIEVRADDWGYDVVVTGSQKALMVPPGLAFASISPRAFARAQEVGQRSLYFDWQQTLKAQRKTPPSTPFTPALTIVQGLEVALGMLHDEGLDNVYARHVGFGRATRAAVAALGFETFSPDHDSSAVLTAVAVPDGAEWGAKLPGLLRSWGITIAGGQDDLKGRIFRLGHCGWVSSLDLPLLIGALERALVELGVDVPVGDGVAALQRSLVGATTGVAT